MGYQRPCDAPVSSSWADHKNRNPPSSEPGTDYACNYGTPLVAPAAGTVTDAKSSNGAATGRYLTLSLDDGRTVRWLHLSSYSLARGERFGRGQVIAYSGASANGSDWGVGAHVHVTLWPGPIWAAATIDFDSYVDDPGAPAPGELEDDSMIRIQAPGRGIALVGPGYIRHLVSDEEVQQSDPLISAHHSGNDRQFDLWASMAYQGTSANPSQPPAADTASGLVAPAWVLAGAVLLLVVLEIIVTVTGVVTGSG